MADVYPFKNVQTARLLNRQIVIHLGSYAAQLVKNQVSPQKPIIKIPLETKLLPALLDINHQQGQIQATRLLPHLPKLLGHMAKNVTPKILLGLKKYSV